MMPPGIAGDLEWSVLFRECRSLSQRNARKMGAPNRVNFAQPERMVSTITAYQAVSPQRTFLVPVAIAQFGIRVLIATMAGLSLAGWLIAVRYAPETKGLRLSEASSLR
jgi:hypothetical protein